MKTTKQTKQLDYTFKVRDFEKSYNKHLKTAQRHEYINFDVDSIMDMYIEELFLDDMYKNPHLMDYRFINPAKEAGKVTQKILKEIKANINSLMYTYLTDTLTTIGKPKSTVTAFYMANYDKVNEIMGECTRNVVEHMGYNAETGEKE